MSFSSGRFSFLLHSLKAIPPPADVGLSPLLSSLPPAPFSLPPLRLSEKEEEDNDEDYKEKLPDLEDLEDTVIEDQGIYNVQCCGSVSDPWVWEDADPKNYEDYKDKLSDLKGSRGYPHET